MIDYPLIYFLNTHGVFVLFLIVLGYLWFFEKSYEEAKHIIITAIIAGAVVLILKELFSIPRPYITHDLPAYAGYSVRTDSLPSLHTALAFALSTTVALHQRRLGIALLLVAALIGFGRIAANVHYPIDVVAGAVVGTVVALLVENLRLPKHKHRS
jgi:undecaprenyl-diphosphatase